MLSVAFVPCAALQALIYWLAKRSFNKPTDSTEKRMEVWFSAMSGIMLGIFVFRTLPHSTQASDGGADIWSYKTLAAFVMAAFYVLMWIDKLGRVWKYSAAFPGLSRDEINDSLRTDLLLDTKQMVLTEYLETTDMGDPEYARRMHRLQIMDQAIERRGRSAILLYILMM